MKPRVLAVYADPLMVNDLTNLLLLEDTESTPVCALLSARSMIADAPSAPRGDC